jgi:uncharacterized protein YdeI (YjbR/CyaY-like superfamily)
MSARARSHAVYFESPAAFRRWLETNHDSATELTVGFHKRHTGQPSLTWPESVDEALCFGWIDGVRHSVDEDRYTIRFTPRKPSSNWSVVNIRRVEALVRDKRMRPAGLRAFEAKRADRSGVYSFEQRDQAKLSPVEERQFRANRVAWRFFEAQPPGYRRVTAFWVVSAKREETRARRLERLIRESAEGQRVGILGRT